MKAVYWVLGVIVALYVFAYVGLQIWAYVVRRRSPPDSLANDH
jgi:hypothetical protein